MVWLAEDFIINDNVYDSKTCCRRCYCSPINPETSKIETLMIDLLDEYVIDRKIKVGNALHVIVTDQVTSENNDICRDAYLASTASTASVASRTKSTKPLIVEDYDICMPGVIFNNEGAVRVNADNDNKDGKDGSSSLSTSSKTTVAVTSTAATSSASLGGTSTSTSKGKGKYPSSSKNFSTSAGGCLLSIMHNSKVLEDNNIKGNVCYTLVRKL